MLSRGSSPVPARRQRAHISPCALVDVVPNARLGTGLVCGDFLRLFVLLSKYPTPLVHQVAWAGQDKSKRNEKTSGADCALSRISRVSRIPLADL